MKKYYLTTLFSMLAFASLQAQNTGGFREVFTGELTGIFSSSVAWGDYDADGDLDIVLTGNSGRDFISKIYKNTGSEFMEAFTGQLTGVSNSSVAWGDYDADGDLDILLSGVSSSAYISKIYQNTGSGFMEVFAGQLTGVSGGSVAWGDYDADGDMDILLSGCKTGGFSCTSSISKIYKNTGSGSGFMEVFAGQLTAVSEGSVAWGDYDADGDLDILLTGYDGNAISKIYQNTGSGFSEVFFGQLTGVFNSSATWGDYDADGDLDIVLTGQDAPFSSLSKIYENTGLAGFTEVYAGQLPGVFHSSAAWGDYDADGDLDILLSGGPISKIYENTGSGFMEVFAGQLTEIGQGSIAWGDYDADGDLDILLTGRYRGSISKIYENLSTSANTAPEAPTGLMTTVAANGVVNFSWDTATDTQTPSAGLNYDIYVGTSSAIYDNTPGKAILSSGKRLNAEPGSLQTNSWTMRGLTNGTYFWSVQAVDGSFIGSPLATESTFTVTAPNTATDITNFSFTEQTGVSTINPTTHTVGIEVASGTNLTGLVATFMLSAGARAAIGTTAQVSGTTANDFTSAVTYTITAQDGTTTQAWMVTVTKAATMSTATDITAFSFVEKARDATINTTNHTVGIEVVSSGTNLTGLVATFTLSPGASVAIGGTAQVSGTTANDFTNPVTYAITAEDGTTTQAWMVTVTNVNNSPTSVTLNNNSIAENADIGTLVGMLFAMDVDAVNMHTYVISGTDVSFWIGGTDNNELQSTISFDFETKSSYAITITATDVGGLSATQDFTINVTDINDVPTDLSINMSSIAENLPVNTIVGIFSTVDEDINDSHTYNLVIGTGSDDNSSFNISGRELQTSIIFDFEVKNSYTIRVNTYDGHGGNFEIPLVITILDVNESLIAGIDNPDNRLVYVYPNPSKGHITIAFDTILKDANWNLYDLTGKALFTKNKPINELETNIDITHLSDGIYLLKIINNDRQITKQISIIK